jgi:hypothetical protein
MFLSPSPSPEEGTSRFRIVTDDRVVYIAYRVEDACAYRILLRGPPHQMPGSTSTQVMRRLRNGLRSLLKMSRQSVEAMVLKV